MFKKLFSLYSATILAFTLTIPAFAETTYRTVSVDAPPKLLILGDSIASGYGLEGYDMGKESCNSYGNQLASLYNEALDGMTDFRLDNLAIDGQTSTELLQRLNNGLYDEQLKHADAVVLSIGGNDLLSVLWNAFEKHKDKENLNIKELYNTLVGLTGDINNILDTFESNLVEIASVIDNRSEAVLVVQTLYNPFNQMNDKIPVKDFTEEKIIGLNEVITTHKDDDKIGYVVADVHAEFVDKANELTNITKLDIHPNQDGHNLIFQVVDKAIRTQEYSYTEAIESQPVVANIVEKGNDKLLFALIGFLAILATIVIIIFRIKSTKRKDS